MFDHPILCIQNHIRITFIVSSSMLHGVTDNFKLHKRVRNILWCCPDTQTFITFAVTHHVAPQPLYEILHDAYGSLVSHLSQHGDSVIATGSFDWPVGGQVVLRIINANNHQTTWGVMASAIWALADWMHMNGIFAGGTFDIYDGPKQVGTGRISGI